MNEAFAAQTCAVERELSLPRERLSSVHGGAIALRPSHRRFLERESRPIYCMRCVPRENATAWEPRASAAVRE